MKNQEKSDLSIFFISEEYKYIFALCYTDKKLRADLLGITEDLYEDNEKAKKWHNRIAKIVHPDTCKFTGFPGAQEATAKLNELYAGMVKSAKEKDDE